MSFLILLIYLTLVFFYYTSVSHPLIWLSLARSVLNLFCFYNELTVIIFLAVKDSCGLISNSRWLHTATWDTGNGHWLSLRQWSSNSFGVHSQPKAASFIYSCMAYKEFSACLNFKRFRKRCTRAYTAAG